MPWNCLAGPPDRGASYLRAIGLAPPGPVQLTADERALFDRIRAEAVSDEPFSDEYGGNVAEFLRRLKVRGAIPRVRWRYFTDADLNPGLRKSRQQVFIDNGCDTAEKIFTSGNFFRYLEYFVTGPQLPDDVVSRFSKLAADASWHFDALRSFVRMQATRLSDTPARDYLGEEFLKLALEWGLDLFEAKMIRTDAMNAVSRSRRKR